MISVQDMAELLYIHDAYDELNQALFGTSMVLGFQEGNWGSLSRIHNLIERNAAERLKKNNYNDVWKIAENKSMSPEKRAQMLLEE